MVHDTKTRPPAIPEPTDSELLVLNGLRSVVPMHDAGFAESAILLGLRRMIDDRIEAATGARP